MRQLDAAGRRTGKGVDSTGSDGGAGKADAGGKSALAGWVDLLEWPFTSVLGPRFRQGPRNPIKGMENEGSSAPANALHRGRLRDVVVLLCAASALFHPVEWAITGAALALVTAGCWLHLLVKGQLIRNVTLCTQGAYAVVRHPYYLANYAIDTGLCLLSGNVLLVLSYPFLFFWAYGKTLRDEEALLLEMHPEEFPAYAARVPAVFPEAASLGGLRGVFRGFSWTRVSRGEFKRLWRFGFLATGILFLRMTGIGGLADLATGEPALSGGGGVMLGVCLFFLIGSLSIPRERRPREETPPECSEETGRDGSLRSFHRHHQTPGPAAPAVLEQEYPLPGTQSEAAARDRNRQ